MEIRPFKHLMKHENLCILLYIAIFEVLGVKICEEKVHYHSFISIIIWYWFKGFIFY